MAGDSSETGFQLRLAELLLLVDAASGSSLNSI